MSESENRSSGIFILYGMIHDITILDSHPPLIGIARECPMCGESKTYFSCRWQAWHCFICGVVFDEVEYA